jgi:hypothetical protein
MPSWERRAGKPASAPHGRKARRPGAETTPALFILAVAIGSLVSVARIPVPELTRSADIKLNTRVSLRHRADKIRSPHRTLPHVRPTPKQSRRAIIFRSAALFCIGAPSRVFADDAGALIQILVFNPADCSDRVLALVPVRARRPDFQTLRSRRGRDSCSIAREMFWTKPRPDLPEPAISL